MLHRYGSKPYQLRLLEFVLCTMICNVVEHGEVYNKYLNLILVDVGVSCCS